MICKQNCTLLFIYVFSIRSFAISHDLNAFFMLCYTKTIVHFIYINSTEFKTSTNFGRSYFSPRNIFSLLYQMQTTAKFIKFTTLNYQCPHINLVLVDVSLCVFFSSTFCIAFNRRSKNIFGQSLFFSLLFFSLSLFAPFFPSYGHIFAKCFSFVKKNERVGLSVVS